MNYISNRLGWLKEQLFNFGMPFCLYEDKALKGILKGVLLYSFFLYKPCCCWHCTCTDSSNVLCCGFFIALQLHWALPSTYTVVFRLLFITVLTLLWFSYITVNGGGQDLSQNCLNTKHWTCLSFGRPERGKVLKTGNKLYKYQSVYSMSSCNIGVVFLKIIIYSKTTEWSIFSPIKIN